MFIVYFLSALPILVHQQDDTGASNPVVEEVMSLSSDSEPLPRLKVRRVTQKVSFSHPLAYQDPQFILKRQVMRAGVTPEPTRTPTSPPGYLTHRGSAELRLFPTCTLFIRWRVLYVSHSILLTQIIKRPPPLRATLCSRTCRLSRLCPGNNDHLMCTLSLLTLLCLTFLSFQCPSKTQQKGEKEQAGR